MACAIRQTAEGGRYLTFWIIYLFDDFLPVHHRECIAVHCLVVIGSDVDGKAVLARGGRTLNTPGKKELQIVKNPSAHFLSGGA